MNKFIKISLIVCTFSLGVIDNCWAQFSQQYGPGSLPASASSSLTPFSYFLTTSQTITLPTNWHVVVITSMGAGGGSGCGAVVTSGTASSGGATGGTGLKIVNEIILPSQVSNSNSLIVTVGAAGSSCVASGTTNGSSGSAPTNGGATYVTLNSIIFAYAGGGGAGSNGSTTGSAGGGTGGLGGNGGNASGATPGTGGNFGAAGSTSTASCSVSYSVLFGCPGTGDPVGTAPSYGFGSIPQEMAESGGAGAGLAATPVALSGSSVAVPWNSNISPQRGTVGSTTCNGTSQNSTNSTWAGVGLYGVGGVGGASCPSSSGGNGGNAAGYGSSGGGGGSTLPGYLAGSAGLSTGGAVIVYGY